MEQQGVLFIVCGPSGVGKTSLCHRLVERFDGLRFSVSYTTRERREGEVDGEDYHFVDEETFDEMCREDAFAEWAQVHGHHYGTTYRVIRKAWESGADVIFDIDYQGARQLKESFPHSTAVLVVPPDMTTLEERLRGRGSESDESLERRLQNAREELEQYPLFDFTVENDEFEDALDRLSIVFKAARYWHDLAKYDVDATNLPSFLLDNSYVGDEYVTLHGEALGLDLQVAQPKERDLSDERVSKMMAEPGDSDEAMLLAFAGACVQLRRLQEPNIEALLEESE